MDLCDFSSFFLRSRNMGCSGKRRNVQKMNMCWVRLVAVSEGVGGEGGGWCDCAMQLGTGSWEGDGLHVRRIKYLVVRAPHCHLSVFPVLKLHSSNTRPSTSPALFFFYFKAQNSFVERSA